jgi:hypothetical protein
MDFVDWYNSVFGVTGVLMNMHELYNDMPNGYHILSEDPMDYKIREIWEDDGLIVPTTYSMIEDLKTADKWYVQA